MRFDSIDPRAAPLRETRLRRRRSGVRRDYDVVLAIDPARPRVQKIFELDDVVIGSLALDRRGVSRDHCTALGGGLGD